LVFNFEGGDTTLKKKGGGRGAHLYTINFAAHLALKMGSRDKTWLGVHSSPYQIVFESGTKLFSKTTKKRGRGWGERPFTVWARPIFLQGERSFPLEKKEQVEGERSNEEDLERTGGQGGSDTNRP